jgi:di/tricarboxylate transporter
MLGRRQLSPLAIVALGVVLWWTPPPAGLTSVLAIAAAVLTGLLKPDDAYKGFSNGTILLIAIAVLVANAVAGVGYLTPRELHRFGAVTTAISFVIYGVVGTAWMSLVLRGSQ